ncbi:hypothetical protein DS834_07915 [Lactobacillus bombicola]|uniref:S-layer protein C-terminal domain-containing protein n=1 Tax=Lactobacillus bombicola TaxID=1505723 RepID=A0ABX9LU69_9LACO|nr:SLAP domain-containing protein [Lactobacillus bombicola]RHW49250.1 hypothetical protein DS834_07915 [Lactobacillus bombicola]
MKKRALISLASAALLSVGAVGIGHVQGADAPQTVQAAKQAKTFKVKLTKNAVVYSSRGKRKTKKTLKKGRTYTAYGKKTIRGKRYYRLSKGRYVKADASVTLVTSISDSLANTSNISSSKTFSVTTNKSTKVYDKNGKATGTIIKKGIIEQVKGIKKILNDRYYKIGRNNYILASDTEKYGSIHSGTNEAFGKGNSNSDATSINDVENPITSDKKSPTQKEINYQLANGYVYFTDDEIKQIHDLLWDKIQNYRTENGYNKYKQNSELDNFINNSVATSTGMYQYLSVINSQDYSKLSKELPMLTEFGMNAMRGIVNPTYYGNDYDEYRFNLKDRNPAHVASDIFESLKQNPDLNKTIKGLGERNAFGSLRLRYEWNGTYSCVGIVFVAVDGTSQEWINYYNLAKD